MAKKKKKGVGKSKSRSSGKNKNATMTAAGVAVGVIGCRLAETYVEKQWPGKVSDKMKSLAEVGVGVVVGLNVLNIKVLNNPFIQGVGMGVGASGVASGAKALGVISGPSDSALYITNRRNVERINGVNGVSNKPYYNVPNIAARGSGGNPDAISVINGRKRRKMSGGEMMYY